MADLLVLPRPANVRMAQTSAEKLEHTGPQCHRELQLASTPEPPLPKGTGAKPTVPSTKS